MNASSFNISEITIQNEQALNPSRFVQLSSGNITVVNHSQVIIDLSHFDANAIKAYQDLAVDNDTTYLSMSDNVVLDISGNQNFPILHYLSLPVSNYTADIIPPVFENFDLNLTANHVVLYFDEPIDMTTFNLSAFSLFDIANTSLQFSINTSSSLPTDNREVWTIGIDQDDVNILNELPICSSSTTCYINFTENLATDTVGNQIVPMSSSLPAQIRVFYPDMVSPDLDHFDLLDLDEGLLTIVFTESVVADSVRLTSLNITNWRNEDNRQSTVVLTSGNVTSINGPSVTIQLTQDDLNAIKFERDTLCTDSRSRQTCWIRYNMLFVTDIAGNPVRALTDDTTFFTTESDSVATLIDDMLSPLLTNFTFDLNRGVLIFTFDEVVDPDEFSAEDITFFGDNFISDASISLTTDSVLTTDDLSLILTVQMGPDDTERIKANLDVAYSADSTLLTYEESFIADVYGNRIDPVNITNATIPSQYIPDQISPVVISFSELSLQASTLSVSFSEPVLSSSFDYSKFLLRSQSTGGVAIQLTGGIPDFHPTDLNVLVIFLSETDVSELKRDTRIGTGVTDSYLQISDNAINDTSGNPVIGTYV